MVNVCTIPFIQARADVRRGQRDDQQSRQRGGQKAEGQRGLGQVRDVGDGGGSAPAGEEEDHGSHRGGILS